MTATLGPPLLLVEDERIVAKDLQAILRVAGYDVAIAASAAEAIESATARRPALALMDIRIRGPVDGIETATILGERFGVRVLYMSADVDPDTRARADRTAPLGFLTKPITAGHLREAVAGALATLGPAAERARATLGERA